MSASFTTYTDNNLINAVFRGTTFPLPANLYLALFTAMPTMPAGTGGTECSGGSYARANVGLTNFAAASGGSSQNGSSISFTQATSPGFGTVVGFGFYDASTAGNLLAAQTLQGTNEVQSMSVTGTPTGGTFTCVFGANTSPLIPYNATAAMVEELLESMPSIGEGNVSVTGGPLPGSALTVTFVGSLGSSSQAVFTLGTNSLTGGSSPAPAFSQTTAGSTGNLVVGTGATVTFNASSLTASMQ